MIIKGRIRPIMAEKYGTLKRKNTKHNPIIIIQIVAINLYIRAVNFNRITNVSLNKKEIRSKINASV